MLHEIDYNKPTIREQGWLWMHQDDDDHVMDGVKIRNKGRTKGNLKVDNRQIGNPRHDSDMFKTF